MQHTLEEVLRFKGGRIYATHHSVPVSHAVRLMNDASIGSVLVMSDGALVGIVTERDVLRRIVDERRHPGTTTVEKVMSSPVRTAGVEMTVAEAMKLMTRERCRHLPVVRNGSVVGLVSIGDLTHWVIQDLETSVVDLSRYIGGSAAVVELPTRGLSTERVTLTETRHWEAVPL